MVSMPVNDIGVSLLANTGLGNNNTTKNVENGFGDLLSAQSANNASSKEDFVNGYVKTDSKTIKGSEAVDSNKRIDDVNKTQNETKTSDFEKKADLTDNDKKTSNTVEKSDSQGKADDTEQATSVVEDEDAAEIMETLMVSAMSVIEQLAQAVDVSVDDVVDTLGELQLEIPEILNSENLTEVFLNSAGLEDTTALLTDENLYGDYQAVMNLFENTMEAISDELNLTEEQVYEFISDKLNGGANENIETDNLVPEADSFDTEVDDYTVENETGIGFATYGDTSDGLGGNYSFDGSTSEDMSSDSHEFDKTTTGDEKISADKQNNFSFGQIQNANTVDDANVTQLQEEVHSFDDNTQNIMNQIMEHFRAQVKGDMSTVEMQLHPASLGTVSVHLASKNGNVTAQFTTSNENVKQILENQLIELKETFEERGVKVDAIEVMVKSHSFEENFNQSNGNGTNEQAKKQGNRRIKLDALNTLDNFDGLDEDEQLAVEIMKSNGNTVDYTA